MSHRTLATAAALLAAAAASIATSPLPEGWSVGDSTETEAFALTESGPMLERSFSLSVSPQTWSDPEPTTALGVVRVDLTGLETTTGTPVVALSLTDLDAEEVLDSFEVELPLEVEQADLELEFSSLVDQCVEGCALLLEAELIQGSLVYGSWSARASVSGGNEDVTVPPDGAEVTLTVDEPGR